MTNGKNLSLGELEALYRQKIQTLTDERAALASQLGECDEKLRTFEEKLRWVRTLAAAPDSSAPLKPPASQRRRRRRSPIKDATLAVLRERPGEWLTARQILVAIRKKTRRASRQAVNVNLNQLEKAGKLRRRPAPPGSGGSQFVYSAV